MESVRHLIVGAGVSGLAMAAFLEDQDTLVVEADTEIGGYCKTIVKEGFVWDYSGHFFHFRRPEIEAWLRARMTSRVLRVARKSFVAYGDRLVDFPFQKNIHQLPQAEFVDCLHDLYFATLAREAGAKGPEASLREMLYSRFGRAIAEKFLVPYNEKLFGCDLASLDPDAMGRFFPHAELRDVIANMRSPDNGGYNATFTYPEGGAIEYVRALESAVRPGGIALGEALVSIDLQRRIATTTKRAIRFEHLISSAPFDRLAAMTGLAHEASVFSWNKVLVFNLGFDRKGATGRHWVYYPDRAISFYRIGYYDNIFDTPRLSLYVELGRPRDAVLDAAEIARLRGVVVADLRRTGTIDDHVLVAEHHVVMDPAYVHITRRSIAERERLRSLLSASGVHSIGRYGGWTYCSIEDNIVEARALAAVLDGRS